jgi:choline dehydrogenase-like flavoprotein
MSATVHSAQIPKVGGELRLVDLPPVEVGPEQVRVSVEACGICHSDHKNISSQGATVSAGVEANSPGAGDGLDASLVGKRAAIRDAALTYWHQTGTAKIGQDAMSVVDGALKVHGVEHVRIADGSIMPRVTTGNSMAP